MKRLLMVFSFLFFLSVVTMAQSSPRLQEPTSQDSPALFAVDAQACNACNDRCVQARENCRAMACAHAGGKSRNASACDGGNPDVYAKEAQGCSNREVACKNSCTNSAACKY
jgi:hypothetical protein